MKFKAFISYRHADLDSFVAEDLHKQLENFKVPRFAKEELREKYGEKQRIFRDREELPVSDNLTDAITEALQESEYLVVVCTPRTPESQWVEKEIETFIGIRGRENVLAVLAEGEPDESFPEAIRIATREVKNSDGTTAIEKYAVEPLAADIRGKDKRAIHKKLKSEILRLEAPMLGCGFDDLKQRHKEQKMKRTVAIMAGVAVVCMAFGSVAASQAALIKSKSVALEEKNRQNSILQAKSLSDRALEQYEAGDRTTAVLLARSAMKQNESEKPIAETENALSNVLRVYDNGTTFEPAYVIENGAEMDQFCLSRDGTKMITIDATNRFAVWDTQTGALLYETTDTTDCRMAGKILTLDNNTCIRCGTYGLVILNLDTFEEQELTSDICYWCEISEDENYMLAGGDNALTVWDLRSMNAVRTLEQGDDYCFMKGTSISQTGKYITYGENYGAEDMADEWETHLGIMNVETGIETSVTLPYGWVSGAVVTDDGKAVVVSKEIGETGSYLKKGRESLVCANSMGEVLWQSDFVSCFQTPMLKTADDMLFLASGSDLYEINMIDGTTSSQSGFSSPIAGFEPGGNETNVICYLEDGSVIQVNTSEDTMTQTCALTNRQFRVKAGTGYGNTLYLLPKDETKVYLYTRDRSRNAIEMGDLSGYVSGIVLNKEETKAVVFSFAARELLLLDCGKGKDSAQTISIPQDCINEVRNIEGTDTFIVISQYGIYQYNWSDAKEIARVDFDEYEPMFDYCFSADGSRLYVSGYDSITTYETNGLGEVSSLPQEHYLNQISVNADGNLMMGVGYESSNAILLDLQSGEITQTDFIPAKSAYSAMKNSYLILDAGKDVLAVYNEKMEPQNSIPMQAAGVQSLGFAPDGQHFFIDYLDKTVEIYDTDTLELQKTITGMEEQIDRWETVCDGKMNVLYGNDTYSLPGYICDEEYNLTARISELAAVTQDGKTVYASASQTVLKYSVLTNEELLQEADKQLNGRELTESEKIKYYIE